MKTVNNILKYGVMVLSVIISGLLFLQSLFTTVKIDKNEKSYFVDGKHLIIVVGILMFIVVFYILHKKINLSQRNLKILTILLCGINCVFVLISQNIPTADQYVVAQYAGQIAEGDFWGFKPADYFGHFPNQYGIVLFYWLVAKLVGANNYIVMQMINVFAIGILYYNTYKTITVIKSEKQAGEIMIGIWLFIPITLYTSFVYGTVIGLCCAVCALMQQQQFFRCNKMNYIVSSAILMGLACALKSNYSVFLIGYIITFLCHFLLERKLKSLVGAAGGVFFNTLISFMVCICLSNIVGVKLNTQGGIPKEAWIVMGMQESPERGPGWFNGYNHEVYADNEFNYEKTKAVVDNDLKKEILLKLEDDRKTMNFFFRKNATLWCEPSFQSLYYNRVGISSILNNHNTLYGEMFQNAGKLYRVVALYMDIFQSFIYLGVLIFILYGFKRIKIMDCTGIIIFIGGFIFHLFWEAKSAYTWTYFVLLIPYAVIGYGKLCDKIKEENGNKGKNLRKGYIVASTIAVSLCIAGLINNNVLTSTLKINVDTEAYSEYVQKHRFVSPGYYYLKPVALEKTCSLSDKASKNNTLKENIILNDTKSAKQKIYVSWNYEEWTCDFTYYNSTKKISRTDVWDLFISDGEFNSNWYLERLNGGYCIRCYNNFNKVITYNSESGEVFLDDYREGDMNQIWEFER